MFKCYSEENVELSIEMGFAHHLSSYNCGIDSTVISGLLMQMLWRFHMFISKCNKIV